MSLAPDTTTVPLPTDAGASCAVCGMEMRRVYNDAGTDFHWVTEGGPIGSSGSPIPGVETKTEWLDWLAVHDVATYSVVFGSCSALLAPWQDLHAPAPAPAYTGEVPECHGAPMQAGRDGWVCRVDPFHG
ncbi:hypothetical protein GCM10011374_30240 [Kocuria dechangensis]|uniref:Uncharacterized protein n=1 Tax=Kocuria dechangensis TaxID=1176249 RepID=A0A917H1K0_9MICC|nr:hypothetical protein [Kocuria dechangensis]GGG64547.1 hypothetical protein GCM10011374_30240 [Kocuria dechangensis]